MKFKTELVEKYMAEHEISKAEFCLRCNITMRDLNKLLMHDFSLSSYRALDIAQLLGVALNELIGYRKS